MPRAHEKLNGIIHQGTLETVLQKLFPNVDIKTNVRQSAKIKNPDTGSSLEIDIWFPSLHLCFEFQDAYHYITSHESQLPLDTIRKKDEIKKEALNLRGETLIAVPCWWDGKEDSLAATIRRARPDLLTDMPISSAPIPRDPPGDFMLGPYIPHVGELMLVSFPSVGFEQSSEIDSPWWLGEKYDGVRCCWVPNNNSLYARSGLLIPLPSAIQQDYPSAFLDGELWCGRGMFTDTQKLIVAGTIVNWANVRTVVFDNPWIELNELPYEKRYREVLESVDASHPFVIPAPRVLCSSKKFMIDVTKEIIEDSGEGVILQKPKTEYIHGRTSSMLKFKASRGDQEALVVGVDEASVSLQLPDGLRFRVEEFEEGLVLAKGDIATFTYENYSRYAIPINPKIYRIRDDVTWEEVVYNFHKDMQLNFQGRTYKPQGYWEIEKNKEQRMAFESFARGRNCDPKFPETWYSIPREEFVKNKDVYKIMCFYKGNVIKALKQLFQELDLDASKFSFQPRSYWKDVANRRKMFTDLADEMGFDPLLPANWYSVSSYAVLNCKGADAVLFYYQGSVIDALLHVFPEIGLVKKEFASRPRNYWSDESNRKRHFIEFAREKRFDPLVAQNWYSVTKQAFMAFKGSCSALLHYNNNLGKALIQLFPNIGLEKDRFQVSPSSYWTEVTHRRAYLDDIAQKKGFDPLVPENWYKRSELANDKAITALLHKYQGSWIKALQHIYPEIGLDTYKFRNLPRNHWMNVENRRHFFDHFAAVNKFDPLVPSNWYSVSRERFMRTKAAASVLHHYRGSLVNALLDLYPYTGLVKSQFITSSNTKWIDEDNRKQLFHMFAKQGNFDPLVAENWYKVTKADILEIKGASSILKYYGGFQKALLATFPNIGFDATKFTILPKNHWADISNRRDLFSNFAKAHDFDPLDTNKWYSVTKAQFLAFKNAGSVLIYYKGSLSAALQNVFLELVWDKNRFATFH
eukprot:Phypoly_transcript_01343.p1 GENE.Phypoly_transcript_01343~~Phypoly_transcript_01343.p1  ORF type:complete len:974 (+),score=101.70 Phypoly_transcript_01343:154-3075(+)